MEQRWRFVLHQTRPATVPPDALIRLQFGRDNSWGAEIIGLPNGVTSRPRCDACSAMPDPWTAATCRCPESPADSGLDHDEFAGRATRVARVDRRASSAERPPPNATIGRPDCRLDDVRRALLGLANGIQCGSVGHRRNGIGRAIGAPGLQARSVLREVQRAWTVWPNPIRTLCTQTPPRKNGAIMTWRVSASSLARTSWHCPR